MIDQPACDAGKTAVHEADDPARTLAKPVAMLGRRHLGEVTASRRVDLPRLQRCAGNQHRRYDGNRLVNRCPAFDHVVPSAEGCLKRLGTDWADLLLIHWPDHITPYGEPIAALEKLKQDGKVRHYGVSNFSPAMMDVCESAGHLAANQVGYHLFDRRVQRAVLPYTRSHGIGFMAYGTLGVGHLTDAFNESTTPVDWDCRSEELKENVAAVEWRLSPEERQEIDTIFAEEAIPTHVETAQTIELFLPAR